MQPWCPGSASLPSSPAAKPLLLRGPADPSSSSWVPASRGDTPRLQINPRLQLEGRAEEQRREGPSWEERGGLGRRWEQEGEQAAGRREALIHAPLGSPGLEQTGREPTEGTDLQTRRKEQNAAAPARRHKGVPQGSPGLFLEAHRRLSAGQMKSNTEREFCSA